MRNQLLEALKKLKSEAIQFEKDALSKSILNGRKTDAIVAQEELYKIERAFMRLEDAVREYF